MYEHKAEIIKAMSLLPFQQSISELTQLDQARLINAQAELLCVQYNQTHQDDYQRPATFFKAKSELLKIEKKAAKMLSDLTRMSTPAEFALQFAGFDADTLAQQLSKLSNISQSPSIFEVLKAHSNDVVKNRKPVEAQTSIAIAHSYIRLTGKLPTHTRNVDETGISGAWPEYLKAIFSLFGLSYSTETWANFAENAIRDFYERK